MAREYQPANSPINNPSNINLLRWVNNEFKRIKLALSFYYTAFDDTLFQNQSEGDTLYNDGTRWTKTNVLRHDPETENAVLVTRPSSGDYGGSMGLTSGGNLIFRQRDDDGNNEAAWALFERDAGFTFYDEDVQLLKGVDGSVYIYSGANTVATLWFEDDDEEQALIRKHTDGRFFLRNREAGQELRLESTAGNGNIIAGTIRIGHVSNASALSFHNTAPIAKPTITGSKGGNAALGNLLTALQNYGLIVDSTT